MPQQFGAFTASELYCPKCKQSQPVRERLLLCCPPVNCTVPVCALRHVAGRARSHRTGVVAGHGAATGRETAAAPIAARVKAAMLAGFAPGNRAARKGRLGRDGDFRAAAADQ